LATHWFFSPPLGGMRTIGVTAGASVADDTICWRFSMYCRQSRRVLMSYPLCSISNTTPSYFSVATACALPVSPGWKHTNVLLPASSARLVPFSLGMLILCLRLLLRDEEVKL